MKKSLITKVYDMGQRTKFGGIYVIQLENGRVFTLSVGKEYTNVQEITGGVFDTFKLGFNELLKVFRQDDWTISYLDEDWIWKGKPFDKYEDIIGMGR